MRRGRFITLEGGEGTGKSTQARRLASRIRAESGDEIVVTREPGGAPGAEAIRSLLVDGPPDRWDARTEVLLHFAARREHVLKTIGPALEKGHWVICDRYTDSTRAYQGVVQGAGLEFVERVDRLAVGTPEPDLTLLLDLPVDEGLRRAAGRGGADRYERMGRAFHDRLRAAFLEVAGTNPSRIRIVDASGSEEDVLDRLVAEVSDRWPLR